MKKIAKVFSGTFALLLLSVAAMAQNVVTGKVTSSDGNPAVGVTVTVKGTKIATQTASDGTFKLSAPTTNAKLVFTSTEFNRTEATANAQGTVAVSLVKATTNMNEVVVIGYGTVQKRNLTGSVSTVTAKDFNKGLAVTPEQLIAGKVAGVTITSNGGQPGQGSTIRIRGGSSINASNDPLVIIDGIPYTGGLNGSGGGENQTAGVSNFLAMINPADIETFTVLKDAASTAIYGSRASNGVILITTKKGKSGAPTYSFQTQLTSSTAAALTPVLSADQFRTYVETHGAASDIAELGKASTNWQKQIYQDAIGTNNNLSISGSLPNIKALPYRLSLGYSNQNGILKTDNLEKMAAGLRLNPRLFDDHLKIDFNLNGTVTNQRFANQGAVGAAVRMDPTQSVYEKGSPWGGYYEWPGSTTSNVPNTNATRNPVALLNHKVDEGQVQKVFGNVQFDYKFHFLPELHANLNLGYEGSKGDGHVFQDTTDASAWGSGTSSGQGYRSQYLQKIANSTAEFYLNYNKDIKSIKSNINATAGTGYYDYLTTNYNYPTRYANGDTNVTSIPVYKFDKPEYSLLSYYARLIYTFNGKYILAASYRTDGSSRFAPQNRWGVFPTTALTWKIKQEDFLKDSKLVSDLKLRLSYGVTGQQAGIPLYLPQQTSQVGSNASLYQLGNQFLSVLAPQGYNTNIKWEQTAAYNLGIDYGFFNNRVSGSVDIYDKKTTGLLNTVNVTPGTNYANQLTANMGDLEIKGIELLLNVSPIKTKNVEWDLAFNAAYNHRQISGLSTDPNFIGIQFGGINGTGNYIQINSNGNVPNAFYAYQQVYSKTTGKPIEGAYVDKNADGLINGNDFFHYKSSDPNYTFGFSTSLRIQKFTISATMHSSLGNYLYNQVRSNDNQDLVLTHLSYLENATKNILYTNFIHNAGSQEFYSNYYIENASFLKMDNIGLTYDFGKVIHNKVGLVVNANVQNVFTITNYSGLDPEVNGGVDNNNYPRPRIVMFGLGLTF